ncbi:MAG: FecR domain-containing protein [Bdellovibrionales bacterium]
MQRNAKRLIISLVISISCALITQIWYQSTTKFTIDYGNRMPVAQLLEVINEVQKKPLKRLVWRGLSNNESVYAGEMIRTTESSQARILFPQTGTEISLEPDTLIMIGEDGGKLSLEFMKGFMHVKGGVSEKLQLKSGNNQIGVNGAELSLGKGDGGAVQLQVFKGEPNVQGTDFQQVKDSFVVLGPLPNSMVHVLPDGKDPVNFKWKELEQAHDVILEAGKSRTTMAPLNINQSTGNQASAFLAPGDYFWRVIAKPKDGKSAPVVSSVYRLRVLPKRAPIALAPTNDANLTNPAIEQKVALRWANPGQLVDIVVELAESADLKTNPQILKSNDLDFMEVSLKNNKTYFWRLTGYLPESKEPVPGPVFKFKLQAPNEFAPPALLSPAANASLAFIDVTTQGVNFRWQSAQGAQGYQLKLKALNSPKPEQVIPATPSPLTQALFKDLTPGEYEWSVASFDGEQKELKTTAKRQFKVSELTKLEWLNSESDSIQFYYGEQPELTTAWKPGPKETASYRVSWREAKPEALAQTAEAKQAQFKTLVASEGRYIASVEAVNRAGLVIAKSNERSVTLKVAPLLEAPLLASQMPDPLKAQRNGKIELVWTNVEGAKEYYIEVKGKDGQVIREEKVMGSKHTLVKLLPGDYTIDVRGVDQAGRRGVASIARPLVVPAMSDVSAPKMKKIKVE